MSLQVIVPGHGHLCELEKSSTIDNQALTLVLSSGPPYARYPLTSEYLAHATCRTGYQGAKLNKGLQT